MQYLLPYLILMNAAGLFLMHQDKKQAKKHQIRIPEALLWAVSLLGGSLGTIIGMIRFRHKTKKPLFSIGLPVLLLVQILVLLLY